MEATSRVLRRAYTWARFRSSLRASLAASLACGAAYAVCRLAGADCPDVVWAAVGVAAVFGWLWPPRRGHALWALGRAVGLGERLAALEALSDRRDTGVAALLVKDIERCGWRLGRLAVGRWELVGMAAGVALVGSLWLPAASDRTTAPLDVPKPSEVHQLLDEEEDAPPQHAQTPVSPSRPDAGTSGYTPYVDLLAAVLGIDAVGELWDDPEALGTALGQQQGLLRELAERLAELASQTCPLAPTGELSDLAAELARDDLREIVLGAVRSGDPGELAGAREALDAVLGASEDATEPDDVLASAEGKGAEADEERAADVPEGAESVAGEEGDESEGGVQGDREAHAEITAEFPELNGTLSAPPALEGGPEEAETPPSEPNGVPGVARGGTPQEPNAGPSEEPDEGDLVPVAVRSDDGSWRAYVVVDAPGEAPHEAGSPVAMSPQEIELLLRVRAVPPGLRDVVRRYFEHVTMDVGGEP